MSRKRRGPTARPSTGAEIDYGRMAAEMVKALRVPAGSTITSVPQQVRDPYQAIPFTGSSLAPRLAPNGGWTDPMVAFGPGRPIPPAAIDPVDPASGRPLPRRYDYPVSANLQITDDRVVPWSLLRKLADASIIRRCIEIRKAEMIAQEWDIGISASALQQAVALSTLTPQEETRVKAIASGDPAALVEHGVRSGVSVRSAERDLRAKYQDDIGRIKTFWRNPDRINDQNLEDWLMVALEEHFVLDALSIYPQLDMAGRLHSFTIIDGSTIKPLLDHRGCIPAFPNPAYQQILHGFPRGEFAATTDATDEFDRDTMIYRPRYRRANSPYGMSNTEQAIINADLYMKRIAWIRSEYTDGVVPEMLIEIDTAMTPQQLLAYERIFNDTLAGQTEERHRAKMLPQGFHATQLQNFEERYRPDYDLHLIRLIGNDFDVLPTELGFPPSGGLGGKGLSEGEENIQYRKGNRPLGKWLVATLNHISSKWLQMPPELTHKFLGLESEDEALAQTIMEGKFHNAGITANEMRDELGLARYDIPDADVPFIITGRDIVPLAGSVDRANAAALSAAQGGPAQDSAMQTAGQPKDPQTPKPTGDHGDPGDNAGTSAAGPQGKAAHWEGALTDAELGDWDPELRAFKTYVRNRQRTGRPWRPFEFKTVGNGQALRLNQVAALSLKAALVEADDMMETAE